MKKFFNNLKGKATNLAIRAKTAIENKKAEGYVDSGDEDTDRCRDRRTPACRSVYAVQQHHHAERYAEDHRSV